MSKSRYAKRRRFRNKEELYESLFEERGVKHIDQYETPTMPYPDAQQRKTLRHHTHIWGQGDRYWKLAAHYYGEPKYWWIIAWYNLKPTDSHCRIGDKIFVPKPLKRILSYFKI